MRQLFMSYTNNRRTCEQNEERIYNGVNIQSPYRTHDRCEIVQDPCTFIEIGSTGAKLNAQAKV